MMPSSILSCFNTLSTVQRDLSSREKSEHRVQTNSILNLICINWFKILNWFNLYSGLPKNFVHTLGSCNRVKARSCSFIHSFIQLCNQFLRDKYVRCQSKHERHPDRKDMSYSWRSSQTFQYNMISVTIEIPAGDQKMEAPSQLEKSQTQVI